MKTRREVSDVPNLYNNDHWVVVGTADLKCVLDWINPIMIGSQGQKRQIA